MSALFLLTLLVAETQSPATEVWAGHYVLEGIREVPLSGKKQVHTETFVIAQVRPSDGRLAFVERICRIDVRPVKKVTVTMSPSSIARLPVTRFTLEEQSGGQVTGSPWTSGWGSEDVDDDGHPGVTVRVGGTFCSGDLYISNQTRTALTWGTLTDNRLEGLVSSLVRQTVLGASGLCLRTMVGNSEEVQSGSIAYQRVAPGTTCQSLAGKPWPVRAAPVPGTTDSAK